MRAEFDSKCGPTLPLPIDLVPLPILTAAHTSPPSDPENVPPMTSKPDSQARRPEKRITLQPPKGAGPPVQSVQVEELCYEQEGCC